MAKRSIAVVVVTAKVSPRNRRSLEPVLVPPPLTYVWDTAPSQFVSTPSQASGTVGLTPPFVSSQSPSQMSTPSESPSGTSP